MNFQLVRNAVGILYMEQIKKSSSIKTASLLFLAQANWSQTRKNAVIRVNKIINITAYQMHNVQIITVRILYIICWNGIIMMRI